MTNHINEQLSDKTTEKPPVPRSIELRRLLALIGLTLFLIASSLPALQLSQGTYPSLVLLLFGWAGAFSIFHGDFSAIGWLANPLFLAGSVALLLGKNRYAAGLLAAATLFAAMSVRLRDVLVDEGGNIAKVEGYLAGFWIWQAAIWFNLLLSIMLMIFTPQTENR